MDKSEKTNSILAIIGLAADIVGLVTFISSYSSASSSSLSDTEPSSFFYIISAFIIFYGWIALGYVFSARKFKASIDYYNIFEVKTRIKQYRNSSPFIGDRFEDETYKEIVNTKYGVPIEKVKEITRNSTVFIGVVIAPIICLWWYAFASTFIRNPYYPGARANILASTIMASMFTIPILGIVIYFMLSSLLPVIFTDVSTESNAITDRRYY